MDGLWSTPTNWDGDMLPTAGDDVFISNGDTVTGIQFNSAWTLTLSGNSTLADPGVWRAGGSTIIVGAGSVLQNVVDVLHFLAAVQVIHHIIK